MNVDLELIDNTDDFPELIMEVPIILHRAAVGRLNWPPQDLASYLVERGLAGQWPPFGSVAELYCEDLGIPF